MRIEITQEDIDQNKVSDPFECPVALACKRAGFPNCSVLTKFFRPDKKGEERWAWPSEVSDWIRKFDDEGSLSVQPAVFEFNWPEKP